MVGQTGQQPFIFALRGAKSSTAKGTDAKPERYCRKDNTRGVGYSAGAVFIAPFPTSDNYCESLVADSMPQLVLSDGLQQDLLVQYL